MKAAACAPRILGISGDWERCPPDQRYSETGPERLHVSRWATTAGEPILTVNSFADTHQFIHGLKPSGVPADVMHMARRCLVDTLAVWAGGVATEPSRIARDHAARRYSSGDVPMPFDGRRVNPVGFAFAGGATVDALDGHDGHQLCKGHAGAALVPALLGELGVAPECGLDEMLTHLIVGYEIALRAGLSLHSTVADYHSSGAWNALGCAAVAARLRGFSSEQTRQALGIAEYYGPRAQMMRCIDHPSMVKDSSSWGALAGVSAADLAEDGFTGAPAITCETDDVAEFWHDIGQRWRILESNFKAYPVCRWAHPAIEGVLSLTRSNTIGINEIEEFIVSTFHEATRLDTRRPGTGDAAQYSLPLVAALAAVHGTVLPEHVLPESYDRPEVWQLVDKVRFEESVKYNDAFPEERCADVALVLSDGRRLRSEPVVARGNFDAPLPDEEIAGKLELYGAAALPGESRAEINSILTDPASAPTPARLVALLQPGN